MAYKSYEGWVVSNGYDVREERFWVMQAACITLADEAIFTCPKSFVSTCSKISSSFVMFECICGCLLAAQYFRYIKTPCFHTAHCLLLAALTAAQIALLTVTAHTAHCSLLTALTAAQIALLTIRCSLLSLLPKLLCFHTAHCSLFAAHSDLIPEN